MKTIMTGGVLAIALSILASASARAGTSASYTTGDWLLGFYDPSKTNQFVIDIGPHTGNTSFTLLNSVWNIGTDLSLSSAFGANWYEELDSSLFYGVVSTTGGPGATTAVFVTNPNGPDDPWETETNEGTPEQAVNNIGGTINSQVQATGQSSVGLIYNANTSLGWAYYANPNNSKAGLSGYYTGQPGGDGDFSDVVTNSLDFEELPAGASTQAEDIGSFSLDSAGDLTYTTDAAVPEPATYATVLLGATLLLLAGPRRRALRPTVNRPAAI